MNKEEADLIIAEQNKSKEEILKAVAKVKADYHELCKLKDMRIADLEHQLTHRNCLDCSNHSSKLRMRTLELEKENAELKETVLQFQKDSYCGMCHFKTKTQLKQAKEIIRELVRVEYADFTNGDYSNELSKVLEQAEQFLSEVENV